MFKYNERKNQLGKFRKRIEDSEILWIGDLKYYGRQYFTFDKDTIFNLHEDYPHNLTKQQKEIFDRDFPELAELFEE